LKNIADAAAAAARSNVVGYGAQFAVARPPHRHAGRDAAKVASQAYAKVVETDEEETPAPATTRARKAKRPVRKAARKTTARARKAA